MMCVAFLCMRSSCAVVCLIGRCVFMIFYCSCGSHFASVCVSSCGVGLSLPSTNSSLTTLSLQGNRIGDAGAAAIGQGLRCAGVG